MDAWLEYVSRLQWQSVGMGLERMTEMVDRLALRRPAQHVITGAGTNGKGTTSALCDAMLRASVPPTAFAGSQARLYGILMFTDDPAITVVGVERAVRVLTAR